MSDLVSKLRVLAVDDEFVIASTWAQILRMSGFEADWATSGEEAIRRARQRCPDVLLTDVMMQGIDGIETATEILKLHPACRVILISGHAETAHALSLSHPGNLSFEILRKPIHPLILLERIRESMQSTVRAEVPSYAPTPLTIADPAPTSKIYPQSVPEHSTSFRRSASSGEPLSH
jgi:DNA-binding NtrC family response regulator